MNTFNIPDKTEIQVCGESSQMVTGLYPSSFLHGVSRLPRVCSEERGKFTNNWVKIPRNTSHS